MRPRIRWEDVLVYAVPVAILILALLAGYLTP
jgi:hypothetical protein